MNEQNEGMTKQTTMSNDLAVAVDGTGAIKGGPRLIIKKAPTCNDETALPDLAPSGDVKGGTRPRCSCGEEHHPVGGFINNHNETIATDEDEEPATTAPLADLEVSDKQAEQTKGGPRGSSAVVSLGKLGRVE